MNIERITPRDEAAWHRLRGKDVTASVIGALFGAHPYMTELELWGLKTGRLQRDDGETEATRRGRLLEPVAVQILREDHPGWKISHNAAENVYYRDPDARIGATPDVLVEHPERGPGIIQIKSVEAGAFRRNWHDEDGEVEAPLWIALQATTEANLTKARWAAVAPMVIGFGIEMPLIDIPLIDGVWPAINDKVAAFWRMVEEGREPEIDYSRDGATIDRLYEIGNPADEVDLTDDERIPTLIERRAQLREAMAAAKSGIAEIDAEIKAKMGEAQVAHIGRGKRITWATRKRAATTTPATTFRALNFPKT